MSSTCAIDASSKPLQYTDARARGLLHTGARQVMGHPDVDAVLERLATEAISQLEAAGYQSAYGNDWVLNTGPSQLNQTRRLDFALWDPLNLHEMSVSFALICYTIPTLAGRVSLHGAISDNVPGAKRSVLATESFMFDNVAADQLPTYCAQVLSLLGSVDSAQIERGTSYLVQALTTRLSH